jgi:hypothetical protein
MASEFFAVPSRLDLFGKRGARNKHKNRRKRQHTSDHWNSLSYFVARWKRLRERSVRYSRRPGVMRRHLRVAGGSLFLWRCRPAREGSARQ